MKKTIDEMRTELERKREMLDVWENIISHIDSEMRWLCTAETDDDGETVCYADGTPMLNPPKEDDYNFPRYSAFAEARDLIMGLALK